MSKTQKNLADAFAGESQANRKYLAFAQKADQDKMPYAAIIFRAAADAETVHAHAHLKAMKGIGSTQDNLKAAIEGETYEFTSMYPEMIKEAQAEGDKVAERGMNHANEAEKLHAELFKKALSDPGKTPPKVWVCQVCGHVAEDHLPDNCPICNSKNQAYKEIV